MPSTVSCCVENSGSISRIEKVASGLRTASMLAIWLAETHADSVEVPVGQRVPEGSGSKFVLETAVAVSVPRVGEVRVTALPFRLTTPVKSSIRSS